MALNATQQWWVRAGGNALNGGGFDAAISGAGTNYSDQDAPQLSLSDFTTSGAGSTTLTSATGGFTAAMIGNIVRIASGTNFQTGYYAVTAVADTNNATLDRTPTSGGAGSSGVGRLGGAFATLLNVSTGGGGGFSAPPLTTPLAAGHTVNVRGAGTDDPSSADYTHTGGYFIFPSGSTASGRVKFVGYNGRPRFNCDALFAYQVTLHWWTNFKFVQQNSTNGTLGVISPTNDVVVDNLYIDCNGFDCVGMSASSVRNCRFTNSGSSAAGSTTLAAIICTPSGVGFSAVGNWINGWRGDGIYVGSYGPNILNNVIINCKKNGIEVNGQISGSSLTHLHNNTIFGNSLDGIKVNGTQDIVSIDAIMNNIVVSNGGYGINCAAGSTTPNDKLIATRWDYNAFYNNTSGSYNAMSAGANDVALGSDPFVNAAAGNFARVSGAPGFPATFPVATTVSYVEIGAVQRVNRISDLGAGLFAKM